MNKFGFILINYMDIKLLENILNGGKLVVVNQEHLGYTFKNGTLTITGNPQLCMVHYEIYEESNSIFIKTTPNLYTEDCRVNLHNSNTNVFTLSGKHSNNLYVVLKKDTFN